jgi:recombination protein RecA
MSKKLVDVNDKKLIDNHDNILKNIVKDIESTFGKGSAMLLGANNSLICDTVSTGSILLDDAIGIGGYPKGRIIEIFGPESSGKTTLSLHAIVEVQKNNGNAAFIDAEHSFNPEHAKKMGVDINKLIISQPDYGEQALDILEVLVKTNEIDLVVIDSVSALVPKKELEGEIEDQNIGTQARMMSRALRRLNGIISKNNCLVIFINQLREKVGLIFGNPETTSGGRALRFYSSLRLDIRKIDAIKSTNGECLGINVRVKIIKNKLAPPFKHVPLKLNFSTGIDKYSEILLIAVSYNIVLKSGT